MKSQYNIDVSKLSHERILELDKLFIDAGWMIKGTNRTIEPHNFRIYQWEHSELEPIYPDGYQPHKEPINFDGSHRPVD